MAEPCPVCGLPPSTPGTGEGCERAGLLASRGPVLRGHILDCERRGRVRAEAERDAARTLAGRLRRAALDALLPVEEPRDRRTAGEVLRALSAAAREVPQEWEEAPRA